MHTTATALCACAAFAATLSAQAVNIAPTGTASQSSLSGYGEQPHFAIDGNRDGYWWHWSSTATNNFASQWWQVVLPAPGPIHEVVIWNRADCCGDRLSNFRIEVQNGAATVFLQDVLTTGGHVREGLPLRMLMPGAGVIGDRVRLTKLGVGPDNTHHLQFSEVEVLRYGALREVNLARFATATQSSAPNGHVASRAVDGGTDGLLNNGSTALTGNGQSWFRIDFARDRVDEIRLWPMTTPITAMGNFRVALFDGATEVFGQDLFTGSSPMPITAPTVLVPPGGATGNALVVTALQPLVNNGVLALAEVELIQFSNLKAEWLPFGIGCLGTAGVPELSIGARPRLGTTATLTVRQVPASPGAAMLAIGFSNAAAGAVPLPFALAPVGMPGCWLSVSLDITLNVAATPTGDATLPVPIPGTPALAGAQVHVQAAALDPTANAFGAVASNAARATIGN